MDKKQAEMKEQIAMMMAKKDYYDILGVPKNVAEPEIKKAYKKLALRFHPDKNSVQGSKQVFKKVSNAYTVLINPQQKQRYDRFGPEQQHQARNRPQNRNHHHHTGDEDFDDFDDIFKAFFGMNGMQAQRNGPRFRTYTYNMGGGGAGPQAQPQQRQGIGLHYLFIVLFLFYAITPLFKSSPYHSFTLNSEYRFKVNSDILNTQYFVREGFFQEVKKDVNFKKQVDLQVDEHYLNTLKKTCEQATRLQKKYEYQGYQYRLVQYRDYYLNEAKKVDMSTCIKIERLYQKNTDYVSQLFYYR